MDEYKEIRQMLKPRRDIKASEAFRNRIGSYLHTKTSGRHGLKFVWGALGIVAAAAIVILLMIPSGLSAKKLLADAISALKKAASIEMKVDIRTDSREIFSYLNINADFVRHDIMVRRTDSLTYWYVNKGERTAEKNPDGLYVWISPFNLGWHYGKDDPDVLGYLKVLMNPEEILESELQYAISDPTTQYDIKRQENEIILTVHALPVGNYRNPYALNSSVLESENIRRYVLDATNHHLRSSTVSILTEGKEIEVIKVTDIDYYPKEKNLPSLPKDITFIEDPEVTLPPGIPGLDAREAASVFLSALNGWNTQVLYKFLRPKEAEEVYRQMYEGAQLLELGHPFRSGSNPHLLFVPYTLRLKGGYVKKMNLALTRYGEEDWRFDGGL